MNLRAIIPCTLILWLGGCVSTMDLGGKAWGAYGELLCHEGGHALSWSGEHEK